MGFSSNAIMLIVIAFVGITIISIVGMGIMTTAIFNIKDYSSTLPTGTNPTGINYPTGNIVSMSNSELVMGKIALGFYWSLCVIAFILSIYIYGFRK